MTGEVVTLPLSSVRPDPEQHRQVFPEEYIADLADSIRTQGQIMPIRVRQDPDAEAGRYVVIDGECRYRACLFGELPTIDAIVCEGVSEFEVANVQAAANLARRDVEPTAAGRAIKRSIDALQAEKRYLSDEEAQRTVCKALGVGMRFANVRLALLRLPEEVRGFVDAGTLGKEAGLELLRLVEAGEEAEAIRQARTAKARSLTVAQVADAAKAYLAAQAQGSLFGTEEVAGESTEAKATKSVLSRLIGLYQRAQEVAFDERKQEFRLGDLQAEDLAMAEAKLIGASNTTHRILAEVQAAQGKTPGIRPVAETVVPRPVQRQQATSAVGVAQEATREPEVPQEGPPEAPAVTVPVVRPAALVKPEIVEFGGEVRVSTVGTWLWVFGVPEQGSLGYALLRAGARWASGRQAWYSPRPEEQAAVQDVLRKHLSEPVETAALEAAG